LLLYHNLLIGTCFQLANRLTGCLLAMAIGRNFDVKAWIPLSLLYEIPLGWVKWFIDLYMEVEGDTDDGKFNPSGAAFAGYPPHDSSPYTLRYAKDTVEYVGQANQGVFSHHFLNLEQTYSYDFSFDSGEIILASRPGTVVDYFDWVADDINPDTSEQTAAANEALASGFLVPDQTNADSWNFITIRHDLDDALNTIPPNNVHDKGPGGTVVQTYGVYGHGRKNSVRELFQARGIASNNIIGQKVRRGERIMRAGDTGVSFHNHLHMMIQEGPAAVGATQAVGRGELFQPTIPFVFKDVTHIIGKDGVCKNLSWYKSSTVDMGTTP
jgi:hypothetical protein